jgi:hypothetical protein
VLLYGTYSSPTQVAYPQYNSAEEVAAYTWRSVLWIDSAKSFVSLQFKEKQNVECVCLNVVTPVLRMN